MIVSVDMEGKTWRRIHKPSGAKMSIHQTYGHLCMCCANYYSMSWVLVWILKGHGTGKQRLKHVVDVEKLFGGINIKFGSELRDEDYRVITVYPE